MSRELHRVFRSQGFNIADEDRGAKIKSQSFLPPTELFELRQHQRLHGTALSGTRPDDTPLHGLVASTGRSPIIESAFHQPLMPHQMGRKPPAKLPNFRPKPPKMPRVTSTHSYGVLPPPTPRERRPRLGKVSPTSSLLWVPVVPKTSMYCARHRRTQHAQRSADKHCERRGTATAGAAARGRGLGASGSAHSRRCTRRQMAGS